MAAAKTTKVTTPAIFQQIGKTAPLDLFFGPQLKHFWEAQEQILDETEAYARGWFERRHTAARTALALVRDAAERGGSDPMVTYRAMMDWQMHSAERLNADMEQWLELCARCANCLSRGEIEAGTESLEGMGEITQQARGARHATPV